MFDSGYPANLIAEEVEKETNLAFPVTKEAYCGWINLCEQLLYSDIVCEERASVVPFAYSLKLFQMQDDLCDEDVPRSSDIHGVFFKNADGVRECEHTPLTKLLRGVCASYAWSACGDDIQIAVPKEAAKKDATLLVIRYARPIPKRTIGDKIMGTIALPAEFLELMRCRLRGEKYRLMNEDTMCAKWINEYNYHVEAFKAFIESRRAHL